MATFQYYDAFTTELAAGTHAAALNADTDVLRVALTNTVPLATHTTIADYTQVTADIFETWPIDVENAATQSGTTITVVGADKSATATGTVNQFRYVILFNDTQADKLIGYWDNGSAVDLISGQTFTVNFGASMFTLGTA
jgi:hypothetical protein